MAVLFRFVNADGTVRLSLDSDSDGLRVQRGLRLGTMVPDFEPMTQKPHPGMIQAGVAHPYTEMFVPVRFAKRQPSIDYMLSLWNQLGDELDRVNIIEFRPHGFDQSFLFDTYCSPVPSLFEGTDFDFQEFLQQVDSIGLIIYRHPHARLAVPNTVSFNRDSIAYLDNGVQVAQDVMRLEDSDAGKAAHVDWGVTNLLTAAASTNFSTGWTIQSGQVTVVDNVAIAPDGTLTADKIEEGATTDQHRLYVFLGDKNTVPMGRSCYAKAAERTWFALRHGGGTTLATFDLVNGVIGTVFAGATARMEYVGDGWWWCAAWLPLGNLGDHFLLGPAIDETGNAYLGEVGKGVYVWHPMVHESQPATPWQIGGTPRLAETLWVPNAPVLDRDAGTIEVRAYADSKGLLRNISGSKYVFRVNVNSDPQYLLFRVQSATQLGLYCGDVIQQPAVPPISEGWHNFSLRWDPIDAAAFIDGVKRHTWRNEIRQFADPQTLHIGTNGGSGEYGGCLFDAIKVSSRPRTDDELAAVGANPLGSDADTTFFRTFSDVTPGKWV